MATFAEENSMSDTVINGMFTLAGVIVGFGLARVKSWWDNLIMRMGVGPQKNFDMIDNMFKSGVT